MKYFKFVSSKLTSSNSVTPVKTGVHPNPLNLDTVFQRYDEFPYPRS